MTKTEKDKLKLQLLRLWADPFGPAIAAARNRLFDLR
jgi:hypothetical protein